ncbi:MAG TPA: dihydropteroate synthase [Candidatus Polarisedimenticolaceae bacterium]|nr:dihydropteroate synthase [Candidatus Polarisedimenticolaceae bacterium]
MEHNPRILELDQLPRALRNMEDMDEAQARRADKLAAGRRRALRLDALDPDTLELCRKEAETHGIVFLPGIAGSQGASPVVLVTDDESFKRLSVAFEARGETSLAAAVRNTLAAYHRQGLGISFADGSRMDLDSAKVMGILNVTPDSFSDGGRFPDAQSAIKAGLKMAAEGADFIDIGGESTRPGAAEVADEEEFRRILPVIEGIKRESDVKISVDTIKARVARRAIAAGADMVNDVSALADPAMMPLLRETRVPVVVMHMRGTPRTMQTDTRYVDLLSSVVGYLRKAAARAAAAGIPDDKVLVDPGIGFGKSSNGNLEILRQLETLRSIGRPILIGASRKSFIGAVLDLPVKQRVEGSLAVAALAVWQGAHVIRAHDVPATVRVVRMIEAIREGA